MTFSAPSLALMLAALAGFAALDAWRRRGAVPPRAAAAWLCALCALAFVAHLGALRSAPGAGLALVAPPPHYHELFHYYLGTKYFAELGYDGLYDAAVLADFVDDPVHFTPDRAMRDLATNRIVRRGEAVARADAIRAPFSPARWESFRRDVSVFREATPDAWRARGPVIDHGYNGTPMVTLVLGGLAAQPWLGTHDYLGLVSLLDPYLLALFAAALAGLEGAWVALAFLFFAFANPLNEYGFTGGGYLRTDYLLALAAALVALRRGARATGGALLALAAALRLFPIAVYGCLLFRDLAGPGWRARLRANARLHAGFAAAALAALALGSLLPTPDGRNAWLACAENIRMHTSAPSANLVSLSALFAYAPYKDRLRFGHAPEALEPAPGEPAFDWIAETQRVLAERRWYHGLAALALVLVALATSRRVAAAEALFPALLIVFAILPVSHYYWALLALVPLAAPATSRLPAWLAVTCAGFALAVWPGLLDAHIDLRFALISLALGAFLLGAQLALLRRGRAARALAPAAVLACLALVGCKEEPLPASTQDAEMPIDGDRYESETYGFSIEKPHDWVFLRGSSLLRDGSSRAEDRWELWQNLLDPVDTPLVAMAPRADASPTTDPMLRIFAIPIERGEGPRGVAFLIGLESTGVVQTFVRRSGRQPEAEFGIVEPAVPLEIGGIKGAGTLVRYRVAEPGDGAWKPVQERLWHVRRGEEFWYFSQLGPEPLSPETLERFSQIIRSVRFED